MTLPRRPLAVNAPLLSLALFLTIAPRAVPAQQIDAARAIGDTVITPSGLRYVYLQRGNGARPDSGDLVVIHGQGRFTDGKVFWDTRKEGNPYEHTYLVDDVIKGFREGMDFMRAGDRVEITMLPALAYGSRDRPPIPPNSTLIFDYEILGVYADALPRLLRDGIAKDGVDATLARLAATPDIWRHYASESGLIAEARQAGEGNPADQTKILEFALTLAPLSYRLHQALARDGMTGAPSAKAVAHFEAAMRLNPRASEREVTEYLMARRAVDQRPYPNGEATMRQLIGELRSGTPDYSRFSPELAALVRGALAAVQESLTKLGELQSLTFQRVEPSGSDHYVATFASGKQTWRLWLEPDGKITGLNVEDIKSP